MPATKLLSILASSLALSAAGAWLSPTAQACRCLQPTVSSSYTNSDNLFRGRSLLDFTSSWHRYHLVQVEQAYKGCLEQNEWLWVKSALDSATCGARFPTGTPYLFATSNTRSASWIQQTNTCAGNREFSSLNQGELEYLNTRERSCGSVVSCASGSAPAQCDVDPCSLALPCETPGPVTCVANRCADGCVAEFYNERGEQVCVDAGPTRCATSADCATSQYCDARGTCVDDGTCRAFTTDCEAPGNDYEAQLECPEGPRYCDTTQRCRAACSTSSECFDHVKYDFGGCDFPLGWLVVDGKCTNISSGCDSLSPGYPTREACEDACGIEPARFACGDLSCREGSEYCDVVIPGAVQEDQQGDPSSYTCKALPERCLIRPSCETCFGRSNPLEPGQFCSDRAPGQLEVSLALP